MGSCTPKICRINARGMGTTTFRELFGHGKNYPQELLANEVAVKLNGTSKRCDTVAYNRFLAPLMIIEYKAPHIEITSAVFDQIVRYNMVLHVKYLTVSNGIRHFVAKLTMRNRRMLSSKIYRNTIYWRKSFNYLK